MLPTSIAATQYDPNQPFIGLLVVAAATERYQSTILGVYKQAILDKRTVTWETFAARPRDYEFPYRYDPLQARHYDWWLNPLHLTMVGGTLSYRRLIGATLVEAVCMSLGLKENRKVALRMFL